MNKFSVIIILFIVFKTEAQTSVLNAADSLYAIGKYSAAIERYQAHDTPSDVFERIAQSYAALGNYEQALSNYKKGLEEDPNNMLLKLDYAKLLYRTKNYDQASNLLKELELSDPMNPNFNYELGLSLEAVKDSTAVNYYRAAFELDSTHQKAIYKIAKQLLIDRKHDQSLKILNIGLRSYETNVELISLKAQNYYWMQDYREASVWFERLIALGESSQFIHERLRDCYLQHFNYKPAAEQGLLALEYEPKNIENLFTQGEIYKNLEQFKEAETYMVLALQLQDIPLGDQYQRLGYVYNRQSKHKEAIDVLTVSLKEDPNNYLTEFYMLSAKDRYYDNMDTRLELYKQFLKKYPESRYDFWIDKRLKELKEEKFLKGEY